jgi:hypothetical protein
MEGDYSQYMSGARHLPGCLVALVDQSDHMSEESRGTGITSASISARAANTVFEEMTAWCFRGEAVRDEFQVAVMGLADGVAVDILGYWTAMEASLRAAKSTLSCYKPSTKSYLKVKLPIAGYYAGFEVYVPEGVASVYFGSYEPEYKRCLRRIIHRHQKAIEDEIGQKSEVTDNGDNKSYWIESYITSHLADEEDWPHVHEWLRVTLEKLVAALLKRLPRTNIPET